jgi:hypothetical protein
VSVLAIDHSKRVVMSQLQHWPLSQEANKARGQCSVCLAERQLHLKDGTVHKHGPRSNPCAGSHKPPISVSNSICPQSASLSQTASNKNTAVSPQDNSVGHPLTGSVAEVTSQCGDTSDTGLTDLSALHNVPRIIKHIPKGARPACAASLARYCVRSLLRLSIMRLG